MTLMTVPLHGKKAAGRVALVDDEDYELVSQYRWHVVQRSRRGRTDMGPYAQANIRLADGRETTTKMHNLIMGAKGIDHRNGDGLDNRRSNLRPATHGQNGANRPMTASNTAGFKGVQHHRGGGKPWRAQIGVGRKKYHLGLFATPEAAARAYDAAARKFHSDFARLNFEENVTSDVE